MLLILEREQFLKLFKFGEIKISINRFIDGFDIDGGKSNIPIELIEAQMPLFEQDHELLILEIAKDVITLKPDISIKISHVRRIYPLTEEASKYLVGRMHPSIVIQKPIFEKLVNEIKINRDFNLRVKAWEALAAVFSLDKSLVIDFSEEIKNGIKARLNLSPNKNKNFLHCLLCFNRNPIYPQGYIEYLFKAATVFVEMKGGTEIDFERGPLYKYLESNISKFSKLSLEESISQLKECLESKALIDELDKQYTNLDALTVGIRFLYFKDILNKNNFDLKIIKNEIDILNRQKPKEVAVVLQMIGMLFNFDNLYSSLYELNSIPIFNQVIDPGVFEQNRILRKALQDEKTKLELLKNELDGNVKSIEGLNSKVSNEVTIIGDSQNNKNINSRLSEMPTSQELNKKTEIVASSNITKKGKSNLSTESPIILKNSAKGTKTRNNPVKLINEISPSTIEEKPGDLFNQPNSSISSDPLFFDHLKINKIVQIVKESNIINDQYHVEKFSEAILNYAEKGASRTNLLNEIEELKKDLRFSQEVENKLKQIIDSIV
jgi:hypothetical protein